MVSPDLAGPKLFDRWQVALSGADGQADDELDAAAAAGAEPYLADMFAPSNDNSFAISGAAHPAGQQLAALNAPVAGCLSQASKFGTFLVTHSQAADLNLTETT